MKRKKRIRRAARMLAYSSVGSYIEMINGWYDAVVGKTRRRKRKGVK